MSKIKLCGLLFVGSLLSLMTSCLSGNNYDADDWTLSNAQIASFSLASESVDALQNVVFTIDQINGLIFNQDSMPFRTVLEDKVIATVGFDNPYGVRSIMFIEGATGDTVQSVSDSINFSEPVMITVTAYDGISLKMYEAKVNIHQVNPDTMIWEKYADILPGKTFQDMKVLKYNDFYYMYVVENSVYQLYRADVPDISNWEKFELTGFPAKALLSQISTLDNNIFLITESGDLYVSADGQDWSQVTIDFPMKTILGYLPASSITGRNDVLCGVADVDNNLRFITVDNQFVCTLGQTVPADFPLSGFGEFHYETMNYPRLVIASGRDSKNNYSNKMWATMDGRDWASLTHPDFSFSFREGTSAFLYGGTFFIIGGIDETKIPLKDICFSIDQGITWFDTYNVYNEEEEEDETRYYFPMSEEFEGRGFMSVIVDDDNYVMLFGGKAGNNTNVLNEIWRGRINRMGFGKER